jgi:hypothetical protein
MNSMRSSTGSGDARTPDSLPGRPSKKRLAGYSERHGDLEEHGSAHAIPGVLVFLELLKADADGTGELSL